MRGSSNRIALRVNFRSFTSALKTAFLTVMLAVTGAAQQLPQIPPCGYGVYPCLNLQSGTTAVYGPDNSAVQAEADRQANERQWLNAYRTARNIHCQWPRIKKGMTKRQKFATAMRQASLDLLPTGERQKLNYICGW